MEHQDRKSPTTDAEIEAALTAARRYEKKHGSDPYATRIEYLDGPHILIVHLSNGRRLAIPVENLQGLENASPAQLGRTEMLGIGYAFLFPDLDADFYVPALMDGVYGNKTWMEELGKRGRGPESSRKRSTAA